MSGFAGIFHSDGAPAERPLALAFADFLAYRGPDARTIWVNGPLGMAHTLLRTTDESRGEQQPSSFDGRCWIVADARLDCRTELIEKLRHAHQTMEASASDSELILRAFAAWGSACVDYLRGDFSFAIWDAGHRQLFCTRDHFGIKPFYYAHLGRLFLFSNTLNSLRLHPGVSTELNDAAIGDFLLFGLNYDNSTTTFRDIQRLPPAHSLTVSARGLQVKRYWTPPTDERIRYTKPEDYLEEFQFILEAAVSDRLRTGSVGILLSGGLDSSSIAAVVKELYAKSPAANEVRGYTYIYKSLIPDQEEEYTREVGEFLRIPVKFIEMDQVQLFERWDDPQVHAPEPVEDPFLAGLSEAHRDTFTGCRVLLSGDGGDDLMDFQMWPYVADLRRRSEWGRLVTDVANYLWIRPFPWRGIRARILRLVGKDRDQPIFPQWLAPEFSSRAHLTERWKEAQEAQHPKSRPVHPIHPRGYAGLASPLWTHLFENSDPGVTRSLAETRYPFLDLRMVHFLLAIPPLPWFFRKTLLREAMRGRLPERVRTRPKTPLQGDPVSARILLSGTDRLKELPWSTEMDRYVDRAAMVEPRSKVEQEEASAFLRPYCLNIWLQSAQRIRYNIHAEASNG